MRPAVVVGIGPQAEQTVTRYAQTIQALHEGIEPILPAVVDWAASGPFLRHEDHRVQRFSLTGPVFDQEADWPAWLPRELVNMSSAQRERTRAWMRAAWLQQTDPLQEFFLESIPRLSSFSAIEKLGVQGLELIGRPEVEVYVIADLNDCLGSGIALDVAFLVAQVCRQLGTTPLTCGVLYLPSAISPAPAEEAMAYAALKELEYYAQGHPYLVEHAEHPVELEAAARRQPGPFNNGCYLMDTVNQVGYTLEDETQLTQIVSEWLYSVTFLGMGTEIESRRERRYSTQMLRGRSRAYESLGLALRYVPMAALANWGAARLVGTITDRVLNGRLDVDPRKRTLAFIEHMGLRTDTLQARIQHENGTEPLEAMAPLYRSGLRQVESEARRVLQELRQEHLTVLDEHVKEGGERMQQEIRQAVAQEIQITLEDMPVGGIPLAYEVLDLLRDRVREMQSTIQRQTRDHQMQLNRSLGTISEAYYALRSATMSIPPWPIAVLGAFALVILPLTYGIQLAWQVVRPWSATWAAGMTALLLIGTIGALGLIAYRLIRQRHRVIELYAYQVRERFELECRPIILRAMRDTYTATEEAIADAKTQLDTLKDQIRQTAQRWQEDTSEKARALSGLSTPGPIRSAVDLPQAERLYQASIVDLDTLIASLVQRIGTPYQWQAHADEAQQPLGIWLGEQIARFGMGYFQKHAEQYQVADALLGGGAEAAAENALAWLLDHAHPWWNYDPAVVRRARTQHLTLIGTDTRGEGWSTLSAQLTQYHPGVVPIDTGDPHRTVALSVHRGLPLYALRRIREYRLHYAEMLWRSRLPLHSTTAFALVDDLLPAQSRSGLGATTLFAAGLALKIVQPDAQGRYIAPRGDGRTIRLSTQKERSAALLGLDAAACREVQSQLDALVVARGPQTVRTAMDEYLDLATGLEAWEIQGILSFLRRYDLLASEDTNGTA